MGPPGIGKTAIMEQIARECGVGLVAYTITHHTRQSAIGLPHIEKKVYDGKEVSVTEYTLSEIIASVYECMERTGMEEGILFIDEINCVSETLAPTMLQFLQNKTFGSHKVPKGWMIVAAGNPAEYNKSVREFDIVTLDRVRKIDIEIDCGVWMEYAWKAQIHGAILSYLGIKEENFYRIENTVDGKFFVTARGWEDLSEILKHYEALNVPVTKNLILQYLQNEQVAGDFAAYYQIYGKYGTDYGIKGILEGAVSSETYTQKADMAKAGSFEERFTVVNLILDYLNGQFCHYERVDNRTVILHESLLRLKRYLEDKKDLECLESFLDEQSTGLEVRIQAELIDDRTREDEIWVLEKLKEYSLFLRKNHVHDAAPGMDRIRELFQAEAENRRVFADELLQRLDQAFRFVIDCFGEAQEMVLFVSGLTRNERAMDYISAHKCESYLHYSDMLLYRKRERELQQECLREMERRI